MGESLLDAKTFYYSKNQPRMLRERGVLSVTRPLIWRTPLEKYLLRTEYVFPPVDLWSTTGYNKLVSCINFHIGDYYKL